MVLLLEAVQYPHYLWGWLVKIPCMSLQWGWRRVLSLGTTETSDIVTRLRRQRLLAIELRAPDSEDLFVEPKGPQDGQVKFTHRPLRRRWLWLPSSWLYGRFLCIPGA